MIQPGKFISPISMVEKQDGADTAFSDQIISCIARSKMLANRLFDSFNYIDSDGLPLITNEESTLWRELLMVLGALKFD